MATPNVGKNRGNAGKGRPKGSKNKTTTLTKNAISMAAEGIGGTDRLIEWIKENAVNERIFWSQMYTKLIPVQHEGSGDDGAILFKTVYEAKP